MNCEFCKKKCVGKKKNTFWRLPPVLTFCLNRFDIYGKKINKLIDFPIGKCNFSIGNQNEKKKVYELIALSNHSGGLLGGHYWAYTKGTNGNWYEYNDDSVSEIDISSLVSSNVYYLVYMRRGLSVDNIIS